MLNAAAADADGNSSLSASSQSVEQVEQVCTDTHGFKKWLFDSPGETALDVLGYSDLHVNIVKQH